MWWVLAGIAAFAFFFVGKPDRATATGGGATVGLIAGVVLAFIYGSWWLVGRAIIVGVLIGLAFELLPRIAGRARD